MADHSGHRDRLRKEFLRRPDAFPDHKLLEILLFYAIPRRDTNHLAHDLMNQFGSIHSLLEATPDQLQTLAGTGEATAVLIKVVHELSRRYYADYNDYSSVISDSSQAFYRQLRSYFYGCRSERAYLLCMDGKLKVLGVRLVGEGSVNAVEVAPRRVMEIALSLNAEAVVLAHNHVSGLALPSHADVNTTYTLRDLLSRVNIQLLDHLVFSGGDMVSLRDSGCYNINENLPR